MGNFKNAKEFDRDPLRKSEIYQKLKPTSGKSLGERWKGRRQTDNYVDLTDDPIKKVIEAEMRKPENQKQDRVKPKNPSRNKLNSQVTPGKWVTK
jgi:hypothetical protein